LPGYYLGRVSRELGMRRNHRWARYQAEFEQLEGVAGFARYQAYLQSIISMSERAALSRIMYLAERGLPSTPLERPL